MRLLSLNLALPLIVEYNGGPVATGIRIQVTRSNLKDYFFELESLSGSLLLAVL
jgi:hypothetical protein